MSLVDDQNNINENSNQSDSRIHDVPSYKTIDSNPPPIYATQRPRNREDIAGNSNGIVNNNFLNIGYSNDPVTIDKHEALLMVIISVLFNMLVGIISITFYMKMVTELDGGNYDMAVASYNDIRKLLQFNMVTTTFIVVILVLRFVYMKE